MLCMHSSDIRGLCSTKFSRKKLQYLLVFTIGIWGFNTYFLTPWLCFMLLFLQNWWPTMGERLSPWLTYWLWTLLGVGLHRVLVLIIGSYLVTLTRLHFKNLSVGTSYFMNVSRSRPLYFQPSKNWPKTYIQNCLWPRGLLHWKGFFVEEENLELW